MTREKRIFWFPFIPTEWITRFNVMGLDNEGRGMFITLLCYQWQEGDISSDPKVLADLLHCRADSPQLAKVLAVFRRRTGNPARSFYPILEALREDAIITSNKRAEAGRNGGRATQKNRRSALDFEAPDRN